MPSQRSSKAPTATDTPPARQPVDQLPVTFFDHAVLAVRGTDGTIYLAVRDLCEAVTLDIRSQLRRIRANPVLNEARARFRVDTSGGAQDMDFLELERVPTWLLMVNTARTGDTVRVRLSHLQRYIIREVYAAFGRLTGLGEASHQIEDLDDLRRIDLAFTALAERQQTIEDSQDRARVTWRDLQATVRDLQSRIAALESRVANALTVHQRGTIYQLVQAWGTARAERHPERSRAQLLAECWTTVKQRYNVARYEDIPAARFRDCVDFVRAMYRATTGADLAIPEQSELLFE